MTVWIGIGIGCIVMAAIGAVLGWLSYQVEQFEQDCRRAPGDD